MNDFQISQIDMFDVMNNIFNIYNSTWSSKTVFAPLVTEFRSNRTRIGQLAIISVRDDTGITIDKNDSRELLIAKAMHLGKAIKTFAMLSGNDMLGKRVSKSQSDLIAMQDTLLIAEMNSILAVANENDTALEDYEIEATDITAFETAITDFEDWKSDPRTASIQRKSANDELDVLIQQTADYLSTRIDPAMYLFETGTDSFYADYFNARTLVDPQTTPLALRGSVQDSETRLPLQGVTIEISDSSLTRTTGETGMFQLASLSAGMHMMNLNCTGYQAQAFQLNIVSGVTSDVVILMVKLVTE